MHYLFHRVRISLYTIFFVNISFVGLFFPFPFPFPCSRPSQQPAQPKILMFDLVVALDSATYNWPCENTGSCKYIPTLGIVCPCALLTVIAKLSRIGNCFRLNWKGNISSSEGHKGIQGRKNPLSRVLSQHNFRVYGILLKPSYDKPGTITKSVRRVNVPKQYDRTTNLQLQHMWR